MSIILLSLKDIKEVKLSTFIRENHFSPKMYWGLPFTIFFSIPNAQLLPVGAEKDDRYISMGTNHNLLIV